MPVLRTVASRLVQQQKVVAAYNTSDLSVKFYACIYLMHRCCKDLRKVVKNQGEVHLVGGVSSCVV